MRAEEWRIAPASILSVRSSFFDDRDRFPAGGAAIDCALLMRDVPVTWEPRSSWTPEAESQMAQMAQIA